MTTVAELHTLTGAYATHALPEVERSAFEEHLAICPSCAREVAEFSATVARLGLAETVVPAPELKQRVLAQAATVRQLAPTVEEEDRPAAVRSRRGRMLGRLALAASVLLAVTAGGLAVQQHQDAQRARSETAAVRLQSAAVSSLLTAPDARTATTSSGGGVGTVVWSQSRDQAAFVAGSLPKLAADHVYQLWYNDAGTMRAAGLLPASSGALVLTGRIDGAVGVGVTVEPSGGSAHPSGAPVMLLPFS
ncbi:anti-sigma factor [Kitasatospora mediocidica]|uniref:anti-sigma factor n=1 Tax=Kitasatospora mediocidica TaxID=58352 RepID=UPI00056B2B37|nr:anti-sigma factor [Kitasatospora mediocidica]